MIPAQSKELPVSLGADEIEKARKAKPFQALCELIANAHDADATRIEITAEGTKAGDDGDTFTVRRLEVADDGHGLPPTELENAFGPYGGSPKKLRQRSPAGRPLIGRFGKGRFKAFALADKVEWVSTFTADGVTHTYSITGRPNRNPFTYTDAAAEQSPERPHGMRVVLFPIRQEYAGRLADHDYCVREITKLTAHLLYRCHSTLALAYNGHPIDYQAEIGHQAELTFQIDLGNGQKESGHLTVI